MNVVEIINLTKKYGDTIALDKVNILIKEGIIYGILGPNGSGKSTLINIISGLIDYDSGSCLVFNNDIKKDKKLIQKNISVVTQDYSLYSDLKARENIMLFAKLSGVRSNEIRRRSDEALDGVNLTRYRNDYPTSFSGGMKRRLNIACALVSKPKILIMDEPTASLDPVSREEIIKMIRNINESGTTIIYTSHYLEEVERICSHATIINKGNVLITDTTRNIIDKYKNRNVLTITLGNTKKSFIDNIREILMTDNKILINSRENGIVEVKVFCDDTAKILQRLLVYCNSNNIYVLDVSIRESTLEEVFFKLVK